MTSEGIYLSIIMETAKSVAGLAQLGAAVLIAKKVFDTLVKVVGDLTAAWYVQERAEAKLNAVLKSTNNAVGMTSRELKNLAGAMQSVTTYGDEMVLNAEAVMLTFTKIGRQAFPDAIKAAADMSAVMGTDLQASVISVGKALQDPIVGVTALRRVGVMLNDQQQAQIKTLMEQNDQFGAQAIILKELQTQFGGAAEAMGTTTAGAVQKLTNALGDLKKAGGKWIAQAANPIVAWLTKIAVEANKALQAADDLAAAFATAGTAQATKDTEEWAAQLMAVAKWQDEIEANIRKQGARGASVKQKEQLGWIESVTTALWAQKAAMDSLARSAEWQAKYRAETAKLEADIADLAAERARKDAEEVARLEAAYKTLDEGKIWALKEEIKYFEEITDWNAEHAEMSRLYLADLYKRLAVLQRIKETTVDYLKNYTTEIADIVDGYRELVQQGPLIVNDVKEMYKPYVSINREVADIVDWYGELVQQGPLIVNDVKEMYKPYVSINREVADIVDGYGELIQQGPLITNEADALAEQSEKTADIWDKIQTTQERLGENLKDMAIQISSTAFLGAMESIGEAMAKGGEGSTVMADTIGNIGKTIMANLPKLLFYAGLQLLGTPAWPVGLALIAASGIVAIAGGVYAARTDAEDALADASAAAATALEDAAQAAADAAQAMADSFVDVFASGIMEGDWAKVEKALTRQISRVVLDAMIAGSAMGASAQILVDAIQKYMAGTGTWDAVLAAKAALLKIGRDIADVFERLFPPEYVAPDKEPIRAFARGGIVLGPTRALLGEAGPEAVIPLGAGGWGGVPAAKYTTVNFNGPTFASEGQLRSYVVAVVRQADRGY